MKIDPQAGFHVERCFDKFCRSVCLHFDGAIFHWGHFGGFTWNSVGVFFDFGVFDFELGFFPFGHFWSSRETPFELIFDFDVFVLCGVGFLFDFVWSFT